MEVVEYWKILRVLTTDICNFDCVFCHNEGQNKSKQIYLNLESFKTIINSITQRPLKEIQFSGGEPFLNPKTIDMIEWVDKNTKLEIGCATNLSVLDNSTIKRLSKTRVSLNIQFPATEENDYKKITRYKGDYQIYNKLQELKKNNISFNLNYVMLKEDAKALETLVSFCLDNSYNLKILPYISKRTLNSNNYKSVAFGYLNEKLGEGIKKVGGAYRWVVVKNESEIVIKYIDSPCFNNNHEICKNYAELRILPDLSMQTCLLKEKDAEIIDKDLENSINITHKMDLLWKRFSNC